MPSTFDHKVCDENANAAVPFSAPHPAGFAVNHITRIVPFPQPGYPTQQGRGFFFFKSVHTPLVFYTSKLKKDDSYQIIK